MSTIINDVEFPVENLLPKKETGVVSFLSKYPTYDGRGIVIAILDSGIDPGAPGLKETSDGKVKVVERFDCSGCGDVVTTTKVTPVDGMITTLTNKKLKIPSTWKNPDNVYRLGVKHAFDLYPDRLKDRVKSEYKRKCWEERNRKVVSDVTLDIVNFELKHQNKTLSDVEKLEKENLEGKQDILNSFDKKYTDSGPVYDCILFHNGQHWVACVDTTENGDLSKCPVLGEYSITHEYAPLTEVDNLNFSVNVHNNGDILELVGICSSHATHVGAIAAGYFPNAPEENGIAPGAQIISLTIGDGRLGSMETGTGLIRAMIKIIELKKIMDVHVINLSYGEHAHWVDTGRIGDLINEIVNKYGITWVSSAGNHGPALNTISTPSDIFNEPIISVGAYVSPEMMVAEYSLRQKLSGTPYTWSSRGPTTDGGIGGHVCAPGGAITSVPNFTLRYSQLINGTSMASPQAAGAICLLISGLIQQKIPYSPFIIRRALQNTAKHLDGIEVLAQGYGLIQVEKAFEYLKTFHNEMDNNVRLQVKCGSGNSKGVYIRSKIHTPSQSFKIAIEPQFLNSDEVPANEKIYFNQQLVLTCEAPYVVFPSHLALANSSRIIVIKVDTSGLAPGVHCTFLNGYDVKCIEKGPLFKVPITVIKPEEVEKPRYRVSYNHINFKPNTIKRHYYAVPKMATWAVLKLISDEDTGRFVIHTSQILPRQYCKALEINKPVAVNSKSSVVISFPVKGDIVLELVVAKHWSNIGESNLDYSITFNGVKPSHPSITMHAAEGIHSVEVTTLQGEDISPSINLKNAVLIIKPAEEKICPLTSRDIIPPSRQIYELMLVYNFNLTKQCEVSPNFILLSNMLYESEYESQLWMLYDSNKQLLGCGDAYPDKYSVKLRKGDYTIKLQVRHDKKDYLEKINDAPLLLIQKLTSPIAMDVYLSYTQALIGGKKIGVINDPNPYTPIPLYIAPLTSDKNPLKSNNVAHYLTGTITYTKDEYGKKADVYPFKYVLVDTNLKKPTPNGNNSDKTKLEEYNDAIRDAKIQWLSKMDAITADKMYEELTKEYSDSLLVHSAYFQVVDPLDKRALPSPNKTNMNISIEDTNKVLNVCNKVLSSLDANSILAFIATKTDLRADAAKIKISMEQQKNVYLECLARKGISLCRLALAEQTKEVPDSDPYKEEISEVWKTLVRFVDPADAKVLTTHVLYFAIWHGFIHNQYGRVLKYLLKMQEDKPNEEVEKKIIEFCDELEWDHVVKHLQRSLPTKFPAAFRPF